MARLLYFVVLWQFYSFSRGGVIFFGDALRHRHLKNRMTTSRHRRLECRHRHRQTGLLKIKNDESSVIY